jgi:hypothetical protein
MIHKVTIAGRELSLEWSQETAKRYSFRMGEVGGEPTVKQLSNPRTVTTALFKVLWGLLPPMEFTRYATPEELFVAVDHENEGEAIYEAIKGIFEDRFVSPEKKSTSKKSPSRKSN